jgi:hypothetical protein
MHIRYTLGNFPQALIINLNRVKRNKTTGARSKITRKIDFDESIDIRQIVEQYEITIFIESFKFYTRVQPDERLISTLKTFFIGENVTKIFKKHGLLSEGKKLDN